MDTPQNLSIEESWLINSGMTQTLKCFGHIKSHSELENSNGRPGSERMVDQVVLNLTP